MQSQPTVQYILIHTARMTMTMTTMTTTTITMITIRPTITTIG